MVALVLVASILFTVLVGVTLIILVTILVIIILTAIAIVIVFILAVMALALSIFVFLAVGIVLLLLVTVLSAVGLCGTPILRLLAPRNDIVNLLLISLHRVGVAQVLDHLGQEGDGFLQIFNGHVKLDEEKLVEVEDEREAVINEEGKELSDFN
jgi:hypothetical protein